MDPRDNPWTWLATWNTSLNALASVLLVVGMRQIRAGRVAQHRRTMWAAFGTSVLFLASYLVYHAKVGSVPFRGTGWMRTLYLGILIPHVVLAALVPFLAIATLYLGEKDRRTAHRRLAKVTWPLWLFVSVSGIAVYILVYWY
jgi:uncharacterized membrane protein YozB (DUF420 family)